MEVNIFAIDPGTTTGWCYVKGAASTHVPALDCDLEIAVGEMSGEEYQQSYDLYRLAIQTAPSAVVIEDFILRKMSQERWLLSPVRITQGITQLLWLANRTWALQQPSLAKTTISDDVLHGAGLWNRGMPHANDATRHALTLLRRIAQKPMIYQGLIEPRGLTPMTKVD